jgi:hypothetical protein
VNSWPILGKKHFARVQQIGHEKTNSVLYLNVYIPLQKFIAATAMKFNYGIKKEDFFYIQIQRLQKREKSEKKSFFLIN